MWLQSLAYIITWYLESERRSREYKVSGMILLKLHKQTFKQGRGMIRSNQKLVGRALVPVWHDYVTVSGKYIYSLESLNPDGLRWVRGRSN